MMVCSYWELLGPAAKGKCFIGPNSWLRDRRFLDSGVGAPRKIVEAYMGEVV